jgi:two-component system response regulator
MSSPAILVVEDNADDEALTLRALSASQSVDQIKVVRDGAEALDFLFASGAYSGRDPGSLPRLVLLDLKLPKVDGLEVLERIRANGLTRDACVVVFTSSVEESDIRRAYLHHANSFVHKPVAFESYTQAVRRLSKYWLQLNETEGRSATPRHHSGSPAAG